MASSRAGELYGLDLLDKSIQDDQDNFTRFMALSRQPVAPNNPALAYKTSVVFSLAEGGRRASAPAAACRCRSDAHCVAPLAGSGVLFKALSCFALRGIDMTKIERRGAAFALGSQLPRRAC